MFSPTLWPQSPFLHENWAPLYPVSSCLSHHLAVCPYRSDLVVWHSVCPELKSLPPLSSTNRALAGMLLFQKMRPCSCSNQWCRKMLQPLFSHPLIRSVHSFVPYPSTELYNYTTVYYQLSSISDRQHRCSYPALPQVLLHFNTEQILCLCATSFPSSSSLLQWLTSLANPYVPATVESVFLLLLH
jgi:hypothetical protein